MNLKKLRDLFEKKGSKAKVCRKTGLSRPTLDAILATGECKVGNLEKIAKALGVSPSIFFDGCEKPAGDTIHIEGHHSFYAKDVDTIDNRETVGKEEMIQTEEVNEVGEEIVLPQDCPDEAKYAVRHLSEKIEYLQKLLDEKNTLINELRQTKEERVNDLQERIKELKERIEEIKQPK